MEGRRRAPWRWCSSVLRGGGGCGHEWSWWRGGGAAWTTGAVGAFLETSLVAAVFVPLLVHFTSGVPAAHRHDPDEPSTVWHPTIFALAVCLQQAVGIMTLLCWLVVLTSDPGYVPLQPQSAVEEEEEEDRENALEEGKEGRISLSEFLMSNNSRNQRECSICGQLKPPRAHHCSLCKRCVIKMDHHCIYLNNCIGYRNLKAFCLFVFYATLFSMGSLAFFIVRAVDLSNDEHRQGWAVVLTVSNLCLLPVVIIFTGGLCLRHLLAILRNQTILEIIINKPPPSNPGPMANLKEVFGAHPWHWLLPIAASQPSSEMISAEGDEDSFVHRSIQNHQLEPLP